MSRELAPRSSRNGKAAMAALLVPLAFLAASTAASAEEEWMRYTNDRFGTAADIPPGFVAGEPSAKGDSLVFVSEDGQARVTVSGQSGVRPEWPREYLRRAKDDGWTIIGSRVDDDFLVFTGKKGDRVFYQKVLVASSCNATDAVRTEYPYVRQEELFSGRQAGRRLAGARAGLRLPLTVPGTARGARAA